MTHNSANKSNMRKFGYSGLVLTTLLLSAVTFALPADDRKVETIDATAMGTSTQMGGIVNVKVTIYEFSTPEDKQVLVDAFKKGRIKDWSTRSPRCRQSAALLSQEHLAMT